MSAAVRFQTLTLDPTWENSDCSTAQTYGVISFHSTAARRFNSSGQLVPGTVLEVQIALKQHHSLQKDYKSSMTDHIPRKFTHNSPANPHHH